MKVHGFDDKKIDWGESVMPHRDQEISLLRKEIEMLMSERQALLQVVGGAASLIAALNTRQLPVSAIESADLVSTAINLLPEETLKDALDSIHAVIDESESIGGQ